MNKRMLSKMGGWCRFNSYSRLSLSAHVLLLALSLGSLRTHLLVVLLQSGQVLSGLGELALLHALTDVPVHEGSLGIHEVELVVDAGQCLGDGGRVGHHAHGSLHAGQVAAGHHCGGLVVDAALEAGGAPVHELHCALRLDGGHGGVHVLGHHVAAVHHAARHELAVAGIALGHHVRRLEHGVGDLGHRQLLVVRLLRRDDRRVRGKHEVDARIRHQVGLELGKIHVQGSVEAQGSRQRRHHLSDQAVQVGVGGSLDVQAASAHVIESLVVEAESAVSVLQQRVRRQHVVVGFHHGGGYLGSRGDGEGQLGLAAVVH
mmetsp:Transcript_7228/g.10754  ORF Transcript_7228/g.10754 Transcript_7228/m.10754 type:complete len:317 (-) Transcript_7228:584-1534(-)